MHQTSHLEFGRCAQVAFGLLVLTMLAQAPDLLLADEPNPADLRVELRDMPKKYKAAKTSEEKEKVLRRAKEIGEKGVRRMETTLNAEFRRRAAPYGPLFQNAAIRLGASGKKIEPKAVIESSEKLIAIRKELQELAGHAAILEVDSPMKKFQTDEEKTAAAMENQRRMSTLDNQERAVIDGINQQRLQRGLAPLRVDPNLCRAAKDHSSDMNRLKFFSHSSPVAGKRRFSDRAKRFGTAAAAENIAKYPTGEQTVSAWMKSDGHRKNILSPTNRIGVGRAGNYYTALFGR